MKNIIHDGKNVNIGRIFGGIGWPSGSPGFACVVGEELYPMVGTQMHRLFVLDEVENENTYQLLNECAKFMGIYNIPEFVGRYDESFMRILEMWNSQQRQFPELLVYSAPNSKTGAIGYHLEGLRNRLHKDRRTLFFYNPESKLPGYLENIEPGVINTATDAQYPAAAALGYCVAYLTEWPPDFDEEDDPTPHDGVSSLTGY